MSFFFSLCFTDVFLKVNYSTYGRTLPFAPNRDTSKHPSMKKDDRARQGMEEWLKTPGVSAIYFILFYSL